MLGQILHPVLRSTVQQIVTCAGEVSCLLKVVPQKTIFHYYLARQSLIVPRSGYWLSSTQGFPGLEHLEIPAFVGVTGTSTDIVNRIPELSPHRSIPGISAE